MRPALQPAAPSRRLLRFLRFQSEGIPFFDHGRPSLARSPCQPRRLATQVSGCKARQAAAPLCAPNFAVEHILPKHMKRLRAPSACATLLTANKTAASRRFASTDDSFDCDRKQTASQRLWGPNAVKPDFSSRNTEDFEDSVLSNMTARRAKAALEPVLRCTEVDEKGDAILIDGAFKKSELIAKVRRHTMHRQSQVAGVARLVFESKRGS